MFKIILKIKCLVFISYSVSHSSKHAIAQLRHGRAHLFEEHFVKIKFYQDNFLLIVFKFGLINVN